MKHFIGALLVLLLGSVLFIGVTRISGVLAPREFSVSAAAPTPAEGHDLEHEVGEGGGTLTSAILTDPVQIDPQALPNPGMDALLPYLFDTLVVWDANARIAPSLARSWQISPDGRSITMELKPEVYFQDGNLLNALAVQATFQRFRAVGTHSPLYKSILQIRQIAVIDDRTVRFDIDGSAADWLKVLASPYAGIISPESAALMEQAHTNLVVGSGPFMVGVWDPGQSITLQRYVGYHWGPSINKNQDAVLIQNVVFQVIPDPAAQVKALKQGRLAAIYVAQPEQWLELQADPALQVIAAPNLKAQDASYPSLYIRSQGLALAPGIQQTKIAATGQMLLNDTTIAGQ